MVDENMSNAARTHAIEWGKGLAGRTLVAFGGSAPIHAARLADKLELDRFVVPADAGVGSAVGFLLAPISYEVVRSRYMRLSSFDAGVVRQAMEEMREEATSVVARGAPGAETTESVRAYMRYVGQGHEIGVEVPEEVVAGTGLGGRAAGGVRRGVPGRVRPRHPRAGRGGAELDAGGDGGGASGGGVGRGRRNECRRWVGGGQRNGGLER